jgi:hypothetical protein
VRYGRSMFCPSKPPAPRRLFFKAIGSKIVILSTMEIALPLPDLLTCRLSIKNGEPLEACRDKVPPSPSFGFGVADGYRVLRAKVEEHFLSKLSGQWNSDVAIFLKPNNNAKQKYFEVVCQVNTVLRAQLEKV